MRSSSLVLVTLASLVVGCGDDPPPPGDDTGEHSEVAAIEITPDGADLEVGDTLSLVAVATDADGEPLDVTFTWATSNGDVVSVVDGTLTALAGGDAEISATAGGLTAEVVVTVAEEVKPFDLSLAGDKLPILQGASATLELTVTRAEGFAGEVLVLVDGLPEGVEASALTIGEDEDRGTLELHAAAGAPHTLPIEVAVVGASPVGDALVEDEEALAVTVYGPPGSVDTSFAGGRVHVSPGASDDYAHAMAIQPDGKVVVVGSAGENLGDFALVRLDRDGALDPTFGDGGVVTTSLGGGDVAYAVAVQADGKIVIAGATTGATTGRDFALLRYEADGSLDEGFGDGGIVTTAFTSDTDTAYAIAIQPDGRIVVGGEANQGTSATGVDFALARYLADGALDPSFGDGGMVTTPLASHGGRDTIYALALQPLDGELRIVAAGGEGDFVLARYLEDGALDPGFGSGGKVMGLMGSTIGAARAVQVDVDGTVVVAGHSHHDFALARLDSAGVPDESFGDDGRVSTVVSATNWDEARGLVIDEDGNLVVAGWVYEGNSSAGDFAVVRYDAGGALDQGFGAGGIVITPGVGPSERDEATAVALQADARVPTVRIVAAGNATDSNSDFAVERYWR